LRRRPASGDGSAGEIDHPDGQLELLGRHRSDARLTPTFAFKIAKRGEESALLIGVDPDVRIAAGKIPDRASHVEGFLIVSQKDLDPTILTVDSHQSKDSTPR